MEHRERELPTSAKVVDYKHTFHPGFAMFIKHYKFCCIITINHKPTRSFHISHSKVFHLFPLQFIRLQNATTRRHKCVITSRLMVLILVCTTSILVVADTCVVTTTHTAQKTKNSLPIGNSLTIYFAVPCRLFRRS